MVLLLIVVLCMSVCPEQPTPVSLGCWRIKGVLEAQAGRSGAMAPAGQAWETESHTSNLWGPREAVRLTFSGQQLQRRAGQATGGQRKTEQRAGRALGGGEHTVLQGEGSLLWLGERRRGNRF
jgi:hypothetical protein